MELDPRSQTQKLAEILRDAMWAEPPAQAARKSFMGIYDKYIYGVVKKRRLRKVKAWKNPNPWLTVQITLEWLSGSQNRKDYLRGEGLPGGINYADGYASIASGEFKPPFLFVAGFPRSGTTSLQNIVLRSFPDNLPRGTWGSPPHNLRLWWYPKHEVEVTLAIANLPSNVSRVFLAIRPLVDSLASFSVYSGTSDFDWCRENAERWFAMNSLYSHENVIPIPFEIWPKYSPTQIVRILEAAAHVPATSLPSESTSWNEIHRSGTSPDMLELPGRSHLPNSERELHLKSAKVALASAIDAETLHESQQIYLKARKRFESLTQGLTSL
jgi:hypothetical protein